MAPLTICQRKHFHVRAKLERGGGLRLGEEPQQLQTVLSPFQTLTFQRLTTFLQQGEPRSLPIAGRTDSVPSGSGLLEYSFY